MLVVGVFWGHTSDQSHTKQASALEEEHMQINQATGLAERKCISTGKRKAGKVSYPQVVLLCTDWLISLEERKAEEIDS